MRFLHTADWHLGRQFHNVPLLEDQAFILEQFIELAKDQKVDAIVIAGDVYDRAVPPAEAVALLNDVLERLVIESGIPVIMISGNHDSAERLGFGSRLLAARGFHVFGPLASLTNPVTLDDGASAVHFCPLPYAEPAAVRLYLGDDELSSHNLALAAMSRQMRSAVPKNERCVAIAHCWVTGGQVSDSERPITVGGSGEVGRDCFAGFNYTALGHLHQPQSAGELIQYSGSLLKYSFSEINHKKSVSLVEIDEAGEVQIERIPLSPRRDVRMVEGSIADLLKGPAAGQSAEDYLLVRLTDKKAIFDAVGKLRDVYPNVLHIERPGFLTGGVAQERSRDHRNRSELDLFRDFYAELTPDPLTAEAEQVFADIVDAQRRGEA